MLPLALRFWILGKKKNFITPGDLVGDFYQSKAAKITIAIVGLLSLLPYAIAQIVAVGKTFESLTSGIIGYELGIVIVSMAIGLYLFYGGSRAVILTDLVQGIVFASLVITGGALCLYWSSGWENLIHNLTVSKPDNIVFDININYYEKVLLAATFFMLPHMWQRMYMAKTSKMLAKNITVLPFAIIALYSCTWLIGISGYSILGIDGISGTDSLLGDIFAHKAPYFGALILVAAFAAGMSTIDSQLLTSAAIFMRDILPASCRSSDQQQFKLSRLITMATLAVCFAAAVLLKHQSTLSLVIIGISLTPIMVPTVYGIFFWRRATSSGAVASMIIGLAVFLTHSFTSIIPELPYEIGPVFSSFGCTMITFISVSLLTKSKVHDFKRHEYNQLLAILSEEKDPKEKPAKVRGLAKYWRRAA